MVRAIFAFSMGYTPSSCSFCSCLGPFFSKSSKIKKLLVLPDRHKLWLNRQQSTPAPKRKYIKRKNPENEMDEVRSRMEALESDNKILRSTIDEMKSQMITDSRYYNQRITEVQSLITTHISRANSAMEEQANNTANELSLSSGQVPSAWREA